MSRANPHTTHDNAGIAAWRFKLLAEIHSYDDCLKFLGGDIHGPVERDLGPKMVVRIVEALELHMHAAAVVLYDTEIIRYYPDGTFSVDNGGFNTPTTTHRLNVVLPPSYRAFHRDKQLALYPTGKSVIAPATHDKRIRIDTGEIVA